MFRQEYSHFPIFAGLNNAQISELDPFLEILQFSENQLIFEQGQIARHLFILLEGEVLVRFKPYDGPPLTVAKITPGGVFGWSAALQHENYTSGAVSTINSCAYRIASESLQQIVHKYPETGVILMERLASVIAERLRNTHTQVYDMLSQSLNTKANSRRRKMK